MKFEKREMMKMTARDTLPLMWVSRAGEVKGVFMQGLSGGRACGIGGVKNVGNLEEKSIYFKEGCE
jgi:hypothetical protein